jgi:putative sigma-54 modulation protein
VQIEYTGRHTEVTPKLKALAEKKLEKLQKVLPGITNVHVILAVDKHRHIAELTVHARNHDMTAVEESGDLATSLATVLEKLARQARKHMGKLRERKRRNPSRVSGRWSAPLAPPTRGDGDGDARVVRSRRFVAKPMTVDEAVLEVSANPEGLVVFRDANTEKLNVLYRRRDGNLGLIEPEP